MKMNGDYRRERRWIEQSDINREGTVRKTWNERIDNIDAEKKICVSEMIETESDAQTRYHWFNAYLYFQRDANFLNLEHIKIFLFSIFFLFFFLISNVIKKYDQLSLIFKNVQRK